MLDNLAILILDRSEVELSLLGIFLAVAGFVLALLLRRGSVLSIRRVPYFIFWTTTYFATSVLPFAWLFAFEAARNGILWLLIGLIFGGIFACGMVFGIIGHARSVNAYGDGGCAWMAAVPFANLVLFLKRPQDSTKSRWSKRAMDSSGVLFGLILMVSGTALSKLAEQQINDKALRAENDPAMQLAGIDILLRRDGLDETLRQLAAAIPSEQLDELTTLLRVEGDGTTLRYHYAVSTDVSEIPISMREGLIQDNCTTETLHPLFAAGATVEHVYHWPDGTEIGTIRVTPQDCAI